jgi:Domain of Unknown Function (DUF1080)
MKHFFPAVLALFLMSLATFAQKSKTKSDPEIKIPMEPAYWEYDPEKTEFTTDGNLKVFRIKNARGNKVSLKNQTFANGTIEFDTKGMKGFAGIYFRMASGLKEGEQFYVRAFGGLTPDNRTTLQYSSVVDSTSMWDMTDEYQAGATIYDNDWNHFKMVMSGRQLRVYVNDMSKPAIVVAKMEGSSDTGSIYFTGEGTYANLVLKSGATEGLSPEAVNTLDYNDTRYVRNWLVSEPKVLPAGKEPFALDYRALEVPDSSANWTMMSAKYRGIINLTPVYGAVKKEGRRIAWMKTVIRSSKSQERILNLGFSDEVWIFINGQFLYADKNIFGKPQQKTPRGRCTLENTSVKIPLREGKNEILIGLASDFYGWGIVARFDDMDGLQLMKESKK